MRKLSFISMAATIAFSSCQYLAGERVQGNGNINTQEHAVHTFKNIDISGGVELYMAQGETKPVKIETDQNLQEYIEVRQRGDKLEIKYRDGFNLHASKSIKVYITAPVYNSIELSGAGNINSQGKIINSEKMSLQISGAGDIDLDVKAPAIDVDVSGAGDVKLKGETKLFDLGLTGAGSAHCFDLLSEETKVNISGTGEADVYASVKLNAQVSGIGSIAYKGSPSEIKQQVSGAGSIKKAE